MCTNRHRLNSQGFQVNSVCKKEFENGAGKRKQREREGEEKNKTEEQRIMN